MTEVFAWLALLILLVLIELATMGLTTIWFAAGALVATIAAACGAPVLVQVILFLVVSVLMLVFTRPVAMRYFNVGRAKTNVDSMLGERGIVTGRIDNLHSCGQVTLKGMEWSARSQETEGTIEEGTVVIVKKIDGVKLIVVPDEIETEEPVTNSSEAVDNMRSDRGNEGNYDRWTGNTHYFNSGNCNCSVLHQDRTAGAGLCRRTSRRISGYLERWPSL